MSCKSCWGKFDIYFISNMSEGITRKCQYAHSLVLCLVLLASYALQEIISDSSGHCSCLLIRLHYAVVNDL